MQGTFENKLGEHLTEYLCPMPVFSGSWSVKEIHSEKQKQMQSIDDSKNKEGCVLLYPLAHGSPGGHQEAA